MKKVFMWVLAATLTCGFGMTLASCSNDDDPVTPQPSLAEALVGEWIFEQFSEGLDVYGADEETESLADGATIAILYHFYDDGRCWKEINLMKDGKLVDQTVSRHATDESTYTIDASGRVVVIIKDADTGLDQTDELTFDGSRLTTQFAGADVPIALVRATDAQTQLYKAESDAWHGGSDEEKVIDLASMEGWSIVTAYDREVFTGKLMYTQSFEIKDGATITLRNVSICEGSDGLSEYPGIECLGNATIILEGSNTVKAGANGFPAIYIPIGSTLTIKGTGSLLAEANEQGAGIGGGIQRYGYDDCGNIIIEGGDIVAKCKNSGRGIGLVEGHGGDITIKATVGSVVIIGGINTTGKITIEEGANVTEK